MSPIFNRIDKVTINLTWSKFLLIVFANISPPVSPGNDTTTTNATHSTATNWLIIFSHTISADSIAP